MYAEPANKVFVQGLVGGLANIVTTAIIGTLLCVAYAATKPKKGSLNRPFGRSLPTKTVPPYGTSAWDAHWRL